MPQTCLTELWLTGALNTTNDENSADRGFSLALKVIRN